MRRYRGFRDELAKDSSAKQTELSEVARDQAEKAGRLASELSALSYERKMSVQDRERLDTELDAMEMAKAQLEEDRCSLSRSLPPSLALSLPRSPPSLARSLVRFG